MEFFVINKDYMVYVLEHTQHKMQIKSKIQRRLILFLIWFCTLIVSLSFSKSKIKNSQNTYYNNTNYR